MSYQTLLDGGALLRLHPPSRRVLVLPRLGGAAPGGRPSLEAPCIALSWPPPLPRMAALVAVLAAIAVALSAAEVAADCSAVMNMTSFYPRTTLRVVCWPPSFSAALRATGARAGYEKLCGGGPSAGHCASIPLRNSRPLTQRSPTALLPCW